MLRNSTPCKVTNVTIASQPRASRGRRTARPSGDDRELAILETATRLLEERSIAEISVDDLAKGAGISRPTYYFYYPSKDALVLAYSAWMQDAHEEAAAAYTGVLDQAILAGDARRETIALNNLGALAHDRGAYTEAIGFHSAALARKRELVLISPAAPSMRRPKR